MNDINFPPASSSPRSTIPRKTTPQLRNTLTIGHELTHAFDDEGRQSTPRKPPRLVDPADAAASKPASTASDQYAGYVIVDDIHINSKLTSERRRRPRRHLLAYIAWKKQTEASSSDKDGFTRTSATSSAWRNGLRNQRPKTSRQRAHHHTPGYAASTASSPTCRVPKTFSCKATAPWSIRLLAESGRPPTTPSYHHIVISTEHSAVENLLLHRHESSTD